MKIPNCPKCDTPEPRLIGVNSSVFDREHTIVMLRCRSCHHTWEADLRKGVKDGAERDVAQRADTIDSGGSEGDSDPDDGRDRGDVRGEAEAEGEVP